MSIHPAGEFGIKIPDNTLGTPHWRSICLHGASLYSLFHEMGNQIQMYGWDQGDKLEFRCTVYRDNAEHVLHLRARQKEIT